MVLDKESQYLTNKSAPWPWPSALESPFQYDFCHTWTFAWPVLTSSQSYTSFLLAFPLTLPSFLPSSLPTSCLFWDRLALNSLNNWEWPCASDLPASSSLQFGDHRRATSTAGWRMTLVLGPLAFAELAEPRLGREMGKVDFHWWCWRNGSNKWHLSLEGGTWGVKQVDTGWWRGAFQHKEFWGNRSIHL